MPIRSAMQTTRAAAARKVPKPQVQFDIITARLDSIDRHDIAVLYEINDLSYRLDAYILEWQASQVSVWRRGWNKLVVWWEGIHDKTGAEI